MKYLFLLLFLSTSLMAKSYKKTFSYDDFYKAKAAINFMRFDMESTKLGMFTTSFHGVVRKANLSYKFKKNTLSNATIFFKVADLDTDVNNRNKKMHNFCFSKDKFSDIIITLHSSIKTGAMEKNISATMNVRGKNKEIEVIIDVIKRGKKLIITGISQVSLKELEIPNPSIWVAKVSDKVEINFNFELDL